MINLKLAEYKDGKFERFLELGKDFIYAGNFIGVYPQSACQAIKKSTIFSSDNFYKFDKDKKDPLNRFDGLFDGRTYGEGRFVLVKDGEDDVKATCNLPVFPFYDPPLHEQKYELKEVIFNIHENPELLIFKKTLNFNLLNQQNNVRHKMD